MSTRITITIGGVSFNAELNDTPVAQAFARALPVDVRMSRWGDEYYGGVGLGQQNDDTAREVVEIGTLGYWPPGDALCFFFGPTPASHGDEPRAASDVSILGKITSDNVKELRSFGGSVSARVVAG